MKSRSSFLLFSFLDDFVPLYPVYMIWFRDLGLSWMNISLLLGIWSLSVIILEFPTGILADAWSRKGAILLGQACKAAGFLLWLLFPGFPAIAAGFVLWGAKEALCSGSFQALVYEELKAEGREDRYEKVMGRLNLARLIGTAIAMAGGALLYKILPLACLGLSTLSPAGAFLVALGFREVREGVAGRSEAAGPGAEPRSTGLANQFKAVFMGFKGAKALVPLIIALTVAGSAYGIIDEYDGVQARERFGLPLVFVGLWSAARFLIEGAGSAAADVLGRIFKGFGMGRNRADKALALLVASAGIAFTLAGWLSPIAGALPYFIFFFLMSAGTVLYEGRLQRVAEDSGRASLLSATSLAMNLVALLLMPLYGLVTELFGLAAVITGSGLLCLMAGLGLYLSSLFKAGRPE